ncbi:MAG: hypothetical protein JNL83_26150 [Myxococcales bacterium]|nr:hypothetical protein [Myxococcales bacterium]
MARVLLVLVLFLAGAGNAVAQPRPAVELEVVLQGVLPPSTVRAEQERILLALIDDTRNAADTEELASYHERLAELYLAQHRIAKAKGDPKAQQEAKLYLIKGVKSFKALADSSRFAAYPKLDRVLFLYGYLLYSGRYLKEARSVFFRLIKDHPTSSFVPASYLVFAEYYFDAGQLADARQFYEKVLSFPKSTSYAYALYKLGFVELAAQRRDLAAEAFERAAKAATLPALQRAAFDSHCRLQATAGTDHAAFDRPDLEAAARGTASAIAAISTCEETELAAQIAAADTMTEDAAVDTRLRVASRLRVAGRHDLAMPLLVAVVEKAPMNGGAERAALLLLDSLVRAKEYDRVLEWVDRFANDKQFLDSRTELQKAIKFLRSRSLRRR